MTALLLQIAGAIALAAGAALMWPPLGFIAAGAALLAFGLAVDE